VIDLSLNDFTAETVPVKSAIKKSSFETSSLKDCDMADVELTISTSGKSNIANPELPTKLVESADQSSNMEEQLDLTKSKNDLSVKSSGIDASKISSDPSNILADIQLSQNSSTKKANQRLIIAEDPEWNLAAVESLSSLALKSIVKNFQGMISGRLNK
jgi:hypothetical protein